MTTSNKNKSYYENLLREHKDEIIKKLIEKNYTESKIVDFIKNDSVSIIIKEHINKLEE